MEDLEAQKRIIDLGKSIVKDLELDSGVDTLSKWMAYYIAEKIKLCENLTGSKKTKAEKECFEIVLKLWENRWSVPPLRDHLKEFTPLLETLKKLNPNRRGSFFYPERVAVSIKEESKIDKSNEVKNHLDTALKVDKLARSIISNLLYQAASQLELNEEKAEYIRNAIELIDYPDTTIIKFTTDYDEYLKSHEDEEPDETRKKAEELQRRIHDLEEFNSLKDSLLERYRKELVKLKG